MNNQPGVGVQGAVAAGVQGAVAAGAQGAVAAGVQGAVGAGAQGAAGAGAQAAVGAVAQPVVPGTYKDLLAVRIEAVNLSSLLILLGAVVAAMHCHHPLFVEQDGPIEVGGVMGCNPFKVLYKAADKCTWSNTTVAANETTVVANQSNELTGLDGFYSPKNVLNFMKAKAPFLKIWMAENSNSTSVIEFQTLMKELGGCGPTQV